MLLLLWHFINSSNFLVPEAQIQNSVLHVTFQIVQCHWIVSSLSVSCFPLPVIIPWLRFLTTPTEVFPEYPDWGFSWLPWLRFILTTPTEVFPDYPDWGFSWLPWLRFFLTTLTEVFPYYFLSCKANSRVKPAKTGHGPHSSSFLCCTFCVVLCIFVLFYVFFVLFCVLFVLCRSLYCLCVYVYCTTATGWLPNCS